MCQHEVFFVLISALRNSCVLAAQRPETRPHIFLLCDSVVFRSRSAWQQNLIYWSFAIRMHTSTNRLCFPRASSMLCVRTGAQYTAGADCTFRREWQGVVSINSLSVHVFVLQFEVRILGVSIL
jgi:hypothetical protein